MHLLVPPLVAFTVVFCWSPAQGHAAYMISGGRTCAIPLQEGQEIMHEAAVLSDEREVEVFRGDVRLSSGDAYEPGEELRVQLSGQSKHLAYSDLQSSHRSLLEPAAGGSRGRSPSHVGAQWVAEAGRGSFKDGACAGQQRAVPDINKRGVGYVTWVLPEGHEDATIWLGYAARYGRVSLTPNLTLTGKGRDELDQHQRLTFLKLTPFSVWQGREGLGLQTSAVPRCRL